jgi:protease I
MASEKLSGKRVAFLVAPEGIEQVELTEPWKAVESAGGKPELLSTDSGEVQAFNHLDKADTFKVDRTVSEADASDYDGLVLPGGVANPDFLRTDEDAVAFVRAFFEQAKPVAAICHAPWTLIEAGANWVDEEVVVDQGLVTSRKPDDLEAFCAKAVEEICEGEHAAQAQSA